MWEMEIEREWLDDRKHIFDASSLRRAAMSATQGSTGRTPNQANTRTASRLHRVNEEDRSNMTRNLESSFMTFDENGNVVAKTPEAAVLAVATYLRLTQPPEGDPRAQQHR